MENLCKLCIEGFRPDAIAVRISYLLRSSFSCTRYALFRAAKSGLDKYAKRSIVNQCFTIGVPSVAGPCSGKQCDSVPICQFQPAFNDRSPVWASIEIRHGMINSHSESLNRITEVVVRSVMLLGDASQSIRTVPSGENRLRIIHGGNRSMRFKIFSLNVPPSWNKLTT